MTAMFVSPLIAQESRVGSKQLHELILRIASGGDNPAEFIETSYRVSETKYQAWQESLRSQFTPARTVKVGKATYRLALLSE
jgi:hypothetical protein